MLLSWCSEQTIELQPANAEARYNLGLALKQQDDFAGAETELRRAAELDTSLPDAPFTLGVVLWQTGRADEAVRALREAITRRPDYADAHYMLGTILKQQGAAAEALAEFRETVKYRPESAEAHLSLGEMLRQAGEADAAAAEMREAERLNRKKADEQASTFAVGVGLQKLKSGDLAGAVANSARPSDLRLTMRRHTISWHSRCSRLARARKRAPISLKLSGSHRICARPPTPKTNSDLAALPRQLIARR